MSDISAIRVNYLAAKITGGVIGSVGLLSTVAGTVGLFSALAEGGLGAAIAIILLVPFIAISALVTTAGVLFLTVGKKHKSKKWKFSTAQIAE